MCRGCGPGRCDPARRRLHRPVRCSAHPSASESCYGYLRIAEPANGRLEIDFDRLAGPDRAHLTAAEGDLRDAASTERLFDREILTLSLPPAVEATARDLVRVNESRARLTLAVSADHTLQQLAHDETILTAANEPEAEAVRSVRRQIGLPPPSTS